MLFSQVRQYIKGLLSRTFSNKSVLDKLNESDNKLTYNGNQVDDFDNLTNRPVKEVTSISNIISPLPGIPLNNIKIFPFTIPINGWNGNTINISVPGVETTMGGILGLNTGVNRNLFDEAAGFHFQFNIPSQNIIQCTRGYNLSLAHEFSAYFIVINNSNEMGIINTIPQRARYLTRTPVVVQNVHLTTTETELTVSESITNMLLAGIPLVQFFYLALGSGNNGFSSGLLLLNANVDSSTGRRYSAITYAGTHKITVGFSEDFKTVYLKSDTTATNVNETYFRGLYALLL